MKYFSLISLFLFSLTLSAKTDRLVGKQLAYYGEDFYKSNPTKESLYKILDNNHQVVNGSYDKINQSCQGDCYKHTSVGYDRARIIMFGEIFAKKDQRGMYVEDVYCGKKFYYQRPEDVSSMHSEVNIEHTWPQSKFTGSFDKNMQKSDMHHLYPTDSDANNRRANHPFGDIGSRHDELNVQNCSNSGLADISGHFIFMPPMNHKGNVARSLFYFATRYKIFIGPAEEIILRQWHKSDPVDAFEKSRHEIIAKHQKVRNPFVDFPELVEKVKDF